MYNTPGTTMIADQIVQDRLAQLLDHGVYRAYGAQQRVRPTVRQLRLGAVIALVLAPFAVLGLPAIPALLLGHYTLIRTRRDADQYEDRTRGVAAIALAVTYVALGVLLLAAWATVLG